MCCYYQPARFLANVVFYLSNFPLPPVCHQAHVFHHPLVPVGRCNVEGGAPNIVNVRHLRIQGSLVYWCKKYNFSQILNLNLKFTVKTFIRKPTLASSFRRLFFFFSSNSFFTLSMRSMMWQSRSLMGKPLSSHLFFTKAMRHMGYRGLFWSTLHPFSWLQMHLSSSIGQHRSFLIPEFMNQ